MKALIIVASMVLTFLGETAAAWDYYHFNLSPKLGEAQWRDALAEELGGEKEIPIEGGRIDVLTDEWAIEVDRPHKWHEGLGQALHYADATGKQGVLALIAYSHGPDNLQKRTRMRFELVEEQCSKNDIELLILFPSKEQVEETGRHTYKGTSDGETRYWLNTKSGLRHNDSCPLYEQTAEGRPCGAEEGTRACRICGG